ncbi:MAG: hypothetical protein L3J21_09820 [Devosiaceae bacterium]|nr:hypothetical protein [Devosiaceae bacterium]
MIRFSLEKSFSVITSVNQRLEKKGQNERDVGIDVDLDVTVPLAVLNYLAIGCVIDYESMFYDPEGNVQPTGITKIVFDRKYEDHRVILRMDNITQQCVVIPDVKLKKFSAEFNANYMAILHLQIQCHPTDEALLFIRQAQIKDGIFLEIEEPAQIDFVEE